MLLRLAWPFNTTAFPVDLPLLLALLHGTLLYVFLLPVTEHCWCLYDCYGYPVVTFQCDSFTPPYPSHRPSPLISVPVASVGGIAATRYPCPPFIGGHTLTQPDGCRYPDVGYFGYIPNADVGPTFLIVW